jgi:hypothetical protein
MATDENNGFHGITDAQIFMTSIVNGMRPIHPGEVLREEFLQPMAMTAHALAMALQLPAPRINGG